jgi:hypothetical protein
MGIAPAACVAGRVPYDEKATGAAGPGGSGSGRRRRCCAAEIRLAASRAAGAKQPREPGFFVALRAD